MRLDKYIANTTDFSRTETKRLIKAGEVRINGQMVCNPAEKLKQTDTVTLEQTVTLQPMVLSTPRPRYFMLHKPAGYVCATKDSEHPIVTDLLSGEPNKHRLQIAGRLDKDTTGLVLITDDGQWNHRITSPNQQCSKHYRVRVARPLHSGLIEQFAAGIQLRHEKGPTRPAQLRIIDEMQAELVIQEGKYHQVKRMFAAIGNHVTHLHRSQIGALPLDSHLQAGQYRSLRTEEIHYFDA